MRKYCRFPENEAYIQLIEDYLDFLDPLLNADETGIHQYYPQTKE